MDRFSHQVLPDLAIAQRRPCSRQSFQCVFAAIRGGTGETWLRCHRDISREDCAMASKLRLAAAALAASVAFGAAPAAYAQHHGGWHGGGWHHGGGWGGAAAGFAAGALIGGALGAAASGPY